MPRRQWREFSCDVVHESVLIRLVRRRGFEPSPSYFVQCNQYDCQYVEENKPPCPLHLGLFADEIRALEEVRSRRLAERQATHSDPG